MTSKTVDISIVINDREIYKRYNVDNLSEILLWQVKKNCDYLDSKGLTYEVLASRDGCSGKYVSNFYVGYLYTDYFLYKCWSALELEKAGRSADAITVSGHLCYDASSNAYFQHTFQSTKDILPLFYRRRKGFNNILIDDWNELIIALRKIPQDVRPLEDVHNGLIDEVSLDILKTSI